MSRRGDPKIRDEKTKDFTCITFKPDLKKFHMEKLDDDIVALFTKRVYDLAGITDRKVSVYLNDQKIDIKTFENYVDLYLKNEEAKELPKIKMPKNDRWEVIVSLSDGAF